MSFFTNLERLDIGNNEFLELVSDHNSYDSFTLKVASVGLSDVQNQCNFKTQPFTVFF